MKIDVAFDAKIITPRKHRALMRECLREAMIEHQNKTLPKHFALGANTRYQYKPISRGYSIKKKRMVHHLIPMVLKGWLRATVLQTSKVTATYNKSRLYARGYFPMKDEFREQIEKVIPSEITDMATFIAKRYASLVTTENWGRKRARRK
jgi:hypothetical protein